MVGKHLFRLLTRGLAVALIGANVRPVSAGDLPTVETIRREAGAVWDKVMARGWVVESEGENRPEGANPPAAAINRTKVHIQWKPPHFRWVSEGVGDGPQPGNVMVKNPAYEFKLVRRTPGTADWALKGWKKTDAPPEQGYRPIRDNTGSMGMFAHLTVTAQPLAQVLAGDGYVFAAPVASPANPGMVRLSYTGEIQPRPELSVAASGWVDLDPATGWSVREREERSAETFPQANVTRNYTNRSRYDVVVDGDGIPVLRRSEGRFSAEGQSPTVGTATFDTRSVAAVNDADFRLTAFGLPEPEGAARSGVPTYLWVIGIAAVSGGLAFAFRRLAAGRGRS